MNSPTRSPRADLAAALTGAYRRKYGFAGVLVGLFVLMDLMFKTLIFPAYLEVVGSVTVGEGSRLALCVKAGALTLAGWVVVAFLLARAIERWRRAAATGAPTEEAILRAGIAGQRLPQRLALAWSAEWLALFTGVTMLGGSPSPLVLGFFLAAMATGPLPVAHSLSTWLVGPVLREVSLLARSRGVIIPAPPLTLRGRLGLYALGLCLAPSFYMAAVVFAARAPSQATGPLLTTVLIFFGAIVLFALICATLLATTITGPVAEMAALMRAISRQGDVSRVGRVPFYQRDEVGALADVTNRMIDRLEVTESDRVASAEALAALNQTLERRVDQRTVQLNRRNAEMRLLLDNVDQGFFTVDRSGAISAEHSAILATWFGAIVPGQPIHQLFGRHDAAFGAAFEMAWSQIVDDVLPLELALGQLPERLVCAGRRYRLSFAPITAAAAGQPDRFLVVVSDETRALEHEALQREKGETLSLFEHMLVDRTGFIGFMDEASAIVSSLVSVGAADPVELKRALHTLKGNAALFGLESVAEICHTLESRMEEDRAPPHAAGLSELAERWSRLTHQVDRLLGQGRQAIQVSPEQYGALERAVRDGVAREDLARQVHELTLEPVERRLNHFADQAARLGRRLDKEIVTRVSHDGLLLDARRWSRVWQAFVHAVRNAVDHGIEPAQERLAAGKPRAGRIDLRGRRDGAGVVIEIEDDGCGIAWDELRRRLEARGLRASTREELSAALFVEGVSTAREISSISGRGVGMGALRSAVQSLGGAVEVDSEPGRGTRVCLRFPESAGAPRSAEHAG